MTTAQRPIELLMIAADDHCRILEVGAEPRVPH